MHKMIMAAAIAVALASGAARAEERVGSAALGALSGAVVLGPVGAVAGAVVGYTAGPAIARSWGLKGSRPPRSKRSAARAPTGPAPKVPNVSGQGVAQASAVAPRTEARNATSAPMIAGNGPGTPPPIQPLE